MNNKEFTSCGISKKAKEDEETTSSSIHTILETTCSRRNKEREL